MTYLVILSYVWKIKELVGQLEGRLAKKRFVGKRLAKDRLV
jgi:hypothetical protein